MNAVATLPMAITMSDITIAVSWQYSTAAMMRPVLQLRASRLTLRASPRFEAGVTEFTARPANCATITSRKLGAPTPRVIK